MSARMGLVIVGIALAVIALAAAALLLPGRAAGDLDRAEALIGELYASGDATDVFRLVDPATVELGPQGPEELADVLEQVLAQPYEVTDRALLRVQGVDIARIEVGEVVSWCVAPEDRILLGCRVARVEVAARTDIPGATIAFSGLDVFADRVDIVTVLEPEAEPVDLVAAPELRSDFVGADVRLAEVDYVMEGQRLRAPDDELLLRPGVGLLFLFEVHDVPEIDALEGARFRYVWPDGEVGIEVRSVLWIVP